MTYLNDDISAGRNRSDMKRDSLEIVRFPFYDNTEIKIIIQTFYHETVRGSWA